MKMSPQWLSALFSAGLLTMSGLVATAVEGDLNPTETEQVSSGEQARVTGGEDGDSGTDRVKDKARGKSGKHAKDGSAAKPTDTGDATETAGEEPGEFRNHGQEVSDFARTTDLEGCEKGHAVAAVAQGQKPDAAKPCHGEESGSVEDADDEARDKADDARDEARDKADDARDTEDDAEKTAKKPPRKARDAGKQSRSSGRSGKGGGRRR